MEACREEISIREATLIERDVWLVENENGVIVGFFGLWPPENDIAEIDPVYVDPRFHGIGVGRALWLQLESRAKYSGARFVGLDSDPQAVGFYKKMGCSVVGQSLSGSIPNRILPRMQKEIG
jgi:ribosomal protein S18 acetylase RimI-like enzyme